MILNVVAADTHIYRERHGGDDWVIVIFPDGRMGVPQTLELPDGPYDLDPLEQALEAPGAPEQPNEARIAALRRLRGHFAAHLSIARVDRSQQQMAAALEAFDDIDLLAHASEPPKEAP